MSLKKLSLAVSLAALLAGPAFADGGPIPAPIPEEPAPPPEEPAAPPPPAPESWLRPAFYLGVGGGVVWLEDIDGLTEDLILCDEPSELDVAGGCPAPNPIREPDGFTTDGGMGWGVFGTAGFRYGYGLRAELEFGYREADLSDFTTDAPGLAGDPVLFVDGRAETVSIMLNVLYDIELSPNLLPYLGGGVGGAHTRISFDDAAVDDEGWAFAWQLIGGVSVPVGQSTELFVDYRYLTTKGFDLDFGGLVEEHDEYTTHTVMAGFRYSFR